MSPPRLAGRPRVLVTGAAGFLGRNLCAALERAGGEVHAAVRRRPQLGEEPIAGAAAVHAADLRRPAAAADLLARARPELVFHSAAHDPYAGADPLAEVVGDDVLTLACLLDACARQPCRRLLFLGSSLVYAASAAAHRESEPLAPASLRGATRAAASLLLAAHGRAGGQAAVELRVFSAYGPWERPRRLVPSAIRAALLGEELPLTAGEQRRDFVFAGDVAEAAVLAAEAPGIDGEVLNLGSGVETSNQELVAAVERAAGRPVRTRPGAYPPRATDREHWRANPEKARRLLGWSPRRSLAEGLAESVEWWRPRLAGSGG